MPLNRADWSLPAGVTYLNHGSWGPAPRVVQQAREEWSRRLESQPMDFFLRQLEPALDGAMDRLAKLVGAESRDLVFVDNATVAMNVVAESIGLRPGDEVLLNDHEYGAVFRIWRRKCEQAGARVVSTRIGRDAGSRDFTSHEGPWFDSAADIVQPIVNAITPRTRLIVVSHVTSPSAVVFPVEELVRRARQRQVPVCIDGPHAIAMQEVNLRAIGCDYYCASLHKWLSAPCGAGFLFVQRQRQPTLQSHMTSWGRSLGGKPERWQDALNWLGTRDPAPFLAVPAAIDCLQQDGFDAFRSHSHRLAQMARDRLQQLFGQSALTPDSAEWYGSMVAVPLPPTQYKKLKPNAMHPLQQQLWERYQIEAPVMECCGRFLLRVSCHWYTTDAEIEFLMQCLKTLIHEGILSQ